MVTSLPDVSEVPDKGFDGWRAWVLDAAQVGLDHDRAAAAVDVGFHHRRHGVVDHVRD